MKRSITTNELLKKRFKGLDLSPKFNKAIGRPEVRGSWIIWGSSFNGKTSFALQLAKELSRHVKVAYNSLEEGVSLSMKKAVQRNELGGCRNIKIFDKCCFNDIQLVLKRPRGPKVVIVDSLQYSGCDSSGYKHLLSEFPDKLFVWVSHADGAMPAGRLANMIRYDASVKVRVEGYVANCLSRYGGGEPYTVWDQGSKNIM